MTGLAGYGDPRLPQRFWAKVRVSELGCWEWTAYLSPAGYGRYYYDGASRLAHRVAYSELRGSIGAGLTIDHLCRNTKCVNPTHLEPVPLRVNVLRSDCPSAINYRATECPSGHPYDDQNTITYRGNRYCRECRRLAKAEARRRIGPVVCDICGQTSSERRNLKRHKQLIHKEAVA